MSEIPKDAVIRRGHLLIFPDGRQQDCGSVNAAKKQSIVLQKLGTTVRVLTASPKEWNPIEPKARRYRKTTRPVLSSKKKVTEEQMAAAARRFVGSVSHDGA